MKRQQTASFRYRIQPGETGIRFRFYLVAPFATLVLMPSNALPKGYARTRIK